MNKLELALAQRFSNTLPKIEERLELSGITVIAISEHPRAGLETNVFLWIHSTEKLISVRSPYPQDGSSTPEPFCSGFSLDQDGNAIVHFFWGGKAKLDSKTGELTAVPGRPW